MAETAEVNIGLSVYEALVNRWFVDYLSYLALDFFLKHKHEDFAEIVDLLSSLLSRPYERTDVTLIRIQTVKLLNYISEVTDSESLITDQIHSLKSALEVLEDIVSEFDIPLQDYESLCVFLQELIVEALIKREDFDQAERLLNRYFPESRVGKSAVLTDLVKKKRHAHPAVQQADLQQLRQDTLAFCLKIFSPSIPFPIKAAVKYVQSQNVEPQNGDAASADEESEPRQSPPTQLNIIVQCLPSENTALPISRLAAAYEDLALGLHQKSFSELEKEVKEETNCACQLRPLNAVKSLISATDVTTDTDSVCTVEVEPFTSTPTTTTTTSTSTTDLLATLKGSPRTLPPTKTVSVPSKRRLFTVAQLVMEPDSQSTSSSTAPSQEEPEGGAERLQEAEGPSHQELQSPVAMIKISPPVRKHRRKTRACGYSSTEENLSNGEDNRTPVKSPAGGSTTNGSHVSSPDNTSSASPRQNPELGRSSGPKTRSRRSVKEPPEFPPSLRSPLHKFPKQQAAAPPCSSNAVNEDEPHISDSSLNSSAGAPPPLKEPRSSSTPHKEKWKQLVRNAKESKEDWSDEDSLFPKVPNKCNDTSLGQKRRLWTDEESNKLKEGVEKFGEGNWGKIKAYYRFKDRTNVNLKDRWRTMKKLNMV